MWKEISKKTLLLPVISLAFFFILTSPALYSQYQGNKYYKNYDYKEFDHQPQNWGFIQHQNGILYVANQGGVLEFDGISWKVIPMENMTVRSIALAPWGTIYVGGLNEMGYLSVDSRGRLKYCSLKQFIDPGHRNFGRVWSTHASDKGIYFRTSNYLFHWDMKAMKTYEAQFKFKASFMVDNRLYIQQQDIGLIVLKSGSLTPVPGGEFFAEAQMEKRICMIAPYNRKGGELLVGTRQAGLFLYTGTTFRPFVTEVDEFIKKNIAMHGIRLSSGHYALGTGRGGLIVFDKDGKEQYRFQEKSGLQNQNVKYLFEDNSGNIWLALNMGITKIAYHTPFFIYGKKQNLYEIPNTICRYRGDLLVGTTRGIYALPQKQATQFTLVAGLESDCRTLLPLDRFLLSATMDGLFKILYRENKSEKIYDDKIYILEPSRFTPGRIWCGTEKGLLALDIGGENIRIDHFQDIKSGIRHIAEESRDRLFLVSYSKKPYEITPVSPRTKPRLIPLDASTGLDEILIQQAAQAAGHVVFCSDKGLFRFHHKKKNLIPDNTLGKTFTGGPRAKPVFRVKQAPKGDIWFNSESRTYHLTREQIDSNKHEDREFLRLPPIQVNTIYPDPDGINTWFGNFDNLIRYDNGIKKTNKSFRIFIRNVTANQKVIFDTYNPGPLPKKLPQEIEYEDRNLTFTFVAPFYDNESKTQFRHMLVGKDKSWSPWQKENQVEYKKLSVGNYGFQVQARNIYQDMSGEASFQFKILLPWYRTWWAYLVFFLFLSSVSYLVTKWRRSIHLEKEKIRLEGEVDIRTREIVEKNKKLQTYAGELKNQSEKLEEMDKIKSRFFANISHEFRTPLTLIMSPLEDWVNENREEKKLGAYRMMLRNSQRLLTLINQLLDLSRFDSGKMRLKSSYRDIVPYLKALVENFRVIAQQNKLTLSFNSKIAEFFLYYDAPKLEEAINNLLINAVKFTPKGGYITLSLSQEEESGSLQISVKDSGTGIPKDRVSHIFERFYQDEKEKQQGQKGSGIGLALTKEIVNLHKGQIDVHSREGKGTEFIIILPPGKDHLKEEEIKESTIEQSRILPPWQSLVHEEEQEEPCPITESDTKKEETATTSILVVEDNSEVRNYIKSSLTKHYKVIEARNGKEGIHKAKKIIPDLVISDIMMPEADGYQLCREIKQEISTCHIPVILLTAKGSQESILEGLGRGADDYIVKPFNTRMLLARVKNLIQLRRQIQLKIQRNKMLLPEEIKVSSMDEKFLKEFQEILEKNIKNPEFNVQKLAKKLYMARSSLFKKVHALTGETPNQFILSYRLERAAQLLKENFGNVTEVAMEVGFSSSTYFATCFSKKYHRSPSVFQAAESNPSSIPTK